MSVSGADVSSASVESQLPSQVVEQIQKIMAQVTAGQPAQQNSPPSPPPPDPDHSTATPQTASTSQQSPIILTLGGNAGSAPQQQLNLSQPVVLLTTQQLQQLLLQSAAAGSSGLIQMVASQQAQSQPHSSECQATASSKTRPSASTPMLSSRSPPLGRLSSGGALSTAKSALSQHASSLASIPMPPVEEDIALDELEKFTREFKRRRIELGCTQGDVGAAMGKMYGNDFSQTTISRFEALNLSYKNMCKLKPMLERWLREADLYQQQHGLVSSQNQRDEEIQQAAFAKIASEIQSQPFSLLNQNRNTKHSLADGLPNLANSSQPNVRRRRLSNDQSHDEDLVMSNGGDREAGDEDGHVRDNSDGDQEVTYYESGLDGFDSSSRVGAVSNSGFSLADTWAMRKRKKRTSIDQTTKNSLEEYFSRNPKPSGEDIAELANDLQMEREVIRVWFCNRRQKDKRLVQPHGLALTLGAIGGLSGASVGAPLTPSTAFPSHTSVDATSNDSPTS